MKLREIRGLIRRVKGNPTMVVELEPGIPVTLTVQKTAFLAALGEAYDAAADTNLHFDEETGVITGPFSDRTPAASSEADDVENGEDAFDESPDEDAAHDTEGDVDDDDLL